MENYSSSSRDTVEAAFGALTGDSPEHGEVPAVGHRRGVCEAVLPQVGPVPGHADHKGTPLASYLADPPKVHGQGAQHKQPSQGCQQEAKYLDETFPHS